MKTRRSNIVGFLSFYHFCLLNLSASCTLLQAKISFKFFKILNQRTVLFLFLGFNSFPFRTQLVLIRKMRFYSYFLLLLLLSYVVSLPSLLFFLRSNNSIDCTPHNNVLNSTCPPAVITNLLLLLFIYSLLLGFPFIQ